MSRNGEKSRGDLYARITDRIIAELERGVRPGFNLGPPGI
jgi:antirestriction protein ArdC